MIFSFNTCICECCWYLRRTHVSRPSVKLVNTHARTHTHVFPVLLGSVRNSYAEVSFKISSFATPECELEFFLLRCFLRVDTPRLLHMPSGGLLGQLCSVWHFFCPKTTSSCQVQDMHARAYVFVCIRTKYGREYVCVRMHTYVWVRVCACFASSQSLNNFEMSPPPISLSRTHL